MLKKVFIMLLCFSISLPTIIFRNKTYALSSNALTDLADKNNMGWTDDDINNFSEFLSISIEHTSKKVSTTYSINKDTGINASAYMNPDNNEEVILKIDTDSYTIYEENDDIYIKNDEGHILKIIDFETTDSISSRANGAFTWSDDSSFTSDYGPYTKTGKYFIDALTFISDVTGYLIDHPILGQIYIATTVANEIMKQSGYMTSYIKFWQAFSKTNSTYVREKQSWYSSSSYSSSSHIKNHVKYFYSSKPY